MGPFDKLIPRSFFDGREITIAVILTSVWVVLLIGYGLGYFGFLGDLAEPRDAAFLEVVFFLMVLVLPIAMVWLMTAMMRRSFQIQDEARRLERQVRDLQAGGGGGGAVSQPRIKDNRVESMQQKVAALTAQVKQMETTVSSVAQMQAAMQVQVGSGEQTNFKFEDVEEVSEEALSWADLIRALDFPRDEQDADGFRALRHAKRDENAGQLLRAAEDILNLLAQEGIYMDDLRPVISPARDWRVFAEGTRGVAVAGVGGIDAPEAAERIAARNHKDQIFRDTSLYFLRRFDIMLRVLVESATDAQVQALADTRTGRAFMLLARSAGMFG